ncbi:hypothetical protein CK203_106083 [Vitis vinifera]|uniref:Reverse transcriptase domain-containing protein n=1 Tax=Vitis vinifera TaxID=29760 RepID=A0A438D7C0_VITVI|nr:hypothetical protein CK203_106083 [Vitis vinifera]
MSRSIKVPVVGLFDLFGEMTIEGVVETNPSIPKVTLPLRAQPMMMPQSPDSNSNTLFGHSSYKVEPTDEDSKIIDLVPRINLESSRLDVEVYVNNMIVKSQGRVDHLTTLERFFEIIRQFRLRLNPKKCTFKVTFGKLGYMPVKLAYILRWCSQPFWIWIGILLISSHGDHIPRSVRLAFSDRPSAMNNIVKYEAFTLGLETTLKLKI